MKKRISYFFNVIIILLLLAGCSCSNTLSHTHQYENNYVWPTCTEQGYTEHICSCGDNYRDNFVSVLGHCYDDWVVIKESTVNSEGIEEQTCQRCGNKNQQSIPKLIKTYLVKYYINGIYEAYTYVEEGKYAPYPLELVNKYYTISSYEDPSYKRSFSYFTPIYYDTNIYCTRRPNFYKNSCLNKSVVQYEDNIDILNNVVENIKVSYFKPAYLSFNVGEGETIIISTDSSYLNMTKNLMFSLSGEYGEVLNGGMFTRLERSEDCFGHSFIVMEFNQPGTYYVAVTYSQEAIKQSGIDFLTKFEYIFSATAIVDKGYLIN